ncbi:hypothetical protein [Thermodesulfovibrio yellowstonii]|uniref:Uncharacterized protein n=1 Tax=Thermodesulfovibrio yellowstonii TaxID=28262 RepID=A0A9W6GEH9_9BACT|nr:hypothetical protein [Thermodesulfovibrio islandicus]GLI52421.1 hypothetical protein TISLANDTSLP1_01140 [Thermodesulfovibrio islandicus]
MKEAILVFSIEELPTTKKYSNFCETLEIKEIRFSNISEYAQQRILNSLCKINVVKK